MPVLVFAPVQVKTQRNPQEVPTFGVNPNWKVLVGTMHEFFRVPFRSGSCRWVHGRFPKDGEMKTDRIPGPR